MKLHRPPKSFFVILVPTIFCAFCGNALALGVGSAPWVGESFRGVVCNGSNPSNFGPWDYTRNQNHLSVVHKAHFTSKVEQLRGGENATGPTSDIDYVLKVFPNHHRALNSAIRFHSRNKRKGYKAYQDKGMTGYSLRSPVECYLQRAINYSPNDAVSIMLYASLLYQEGNLELSLQNYKKARGLSPNSTNIEYNYALLLVDLQQYEEARSIAKKLYTAGFPLPGLKNKLIRADQWE